MSKSIDWVPLSSVLSAIVDNRGKTVPTVESGFPLIATNCIKETSIYPTFENIRYVSEATLSSWFRAHLEPNDILFVNKGTPGRVCLVPDPVSFCAAQDMIGFRVNSSKIDYRYLFAFLRSDWVKQTIANNHVGLVIPHFRKQDLDSLSVPMRSRSDQEKIGELYLLLSGKIELNQRINSELEGMAKLLYDYWFVQYDFPLSAAQAAALGKPRLAGKPYRSSGGPMVYHEQLKREIPKGWKVGNISELCHLNHRTWPNKDHPAQVIYLDLANAKNGEILSVQNFHWNEAPSRARRILTPGDTIFGTVRPGNRSFALVPESEETLTGSTGFAVLTPKSAIYREFNYLSLTSESNINRLTTVASGAAYPAVNPEVVAAQTLALPDTDLIQQFHQTTASFFDLIERHRAQNQELTTLRDWLLPMLMNGQVTVS